MIGYGMRNAWCRRASSRIIWLAALLLALSVWLPACVNAAEYSTGPAPDWVMPVKPGVATSDQLAQRSGGVVYLLTDVQRRADRQQRVGYYRLVRTAINAKGVDEVANIELAFDPSYQSLTLHWITIVRDGTVIAKLATAKIHVIQRETELEAKIYDGSKSVNVFLDDVRVGDTIDYAYSITGRNPVFGGREFGTFSLQFSVPVARIHRRLLLPAGMHVVLERRHTTAAATTSQHDGWQDHVWDVSDVPGLKVENGAPDWYSPYGEVSWSEFPDWGAVARWARPLYQPPVNLSPALQVQVDQIAAAEPTAEGKMLAVLRLVQTDVRYLGVEIGQNSHAPTTPSVVYERRFGDCKDKTLLTLTLLGRLGVEAYPALVNTRVRKGLSDVVASPGAFDHVLVQARVGGRNWWIDPTRDTQNTTLENLFQPDFGLALVVDRHARGLTAMRRAEPASSSRKLRAVFDARAGFDKPVPFSMETTTEGQAADSLRGWLSATNLVDAQKSYLNFYANSYSSIAVAAPLQVRDDEAQNRLVTTESYRIDAFSEPSEEDAGNLAQIAFPDITHVLQDPSVTVRSSPLELAYPQDIRQHTEVLLPEEWPVEPSTKVISDPAFRYTQTVAASGHKVIITSHFQSLVDEIQAEHLPRYLANLARARAIAGFQFTWASPTAETGASGVDRMNWPVALLALGMVGLFAWLAMLVYRYDPLPAAAPDLQWAGIAGWLLVLAFVFAIRPLVLGSTLGDLVDVMSIHTWSVLTTFGSSTYHALWAPLLLFELAAAMAQITFAVLVLLLLFKRRTSFPRMALLALSAGVLLQLVDLWLVSLLPATEVTAKDVSQAIGNVLGAALWIGYLLRSRRVKATFVRRYQGNLPPPMHPWPGMPKEPPPLLGGT